MLYTPTKHCGIKMTCENAYVHANTWSKTHKEKIVAVGGTVRDQGAQSMAALDKVMSSTEAPLPTVDEMAKNLKDYDINFTVKQARQSATTWREKNGVVRKSQVARQHEEVKSKRKREISTRRWTFEVSKSLSKL